MNHFALKQQLYLKALKTCLAELRQFKEHAQSTISVNFA
jgi:hypothetical protein